MDGLHLLAYLIVNLACLAVGCLYSLALYGSSGLLLDEDFHIL